MQKANARMILRGGRRMKLDLLPTAFPSGSLFSTIETVKMKREELVLRLGILKGTKTDRRGEKVREYVP